MITVCTETVVARIASNFYLRLRSLLGHVECAEAKLLSHKNDSKANKKADIQDGYRLDVFDNLFWATP